MQASPLGAGETGRGAGGRLFHAQTFSQPGTSLASVETKWKVLFLPLTVSMFSQTRAGGVFCPSVSVTPPLFAFHLLEIYRYFFRTGDSTHIIFAVSFYILCYFYCLFIFNVREMLRRGDEPRRWAWVLIHCLQLENLAYKSKNF